jgi:hypothetical protein
MTIDPNNAKVAFLGRPDVERSAGAAVRRSTKVLMKRGLISAKQMRRVTGSQKDAEHGKGK